MFANAVMRLDAGFADAKGGLAGLARGSFFRQASCVAYAEGATGLARAGPLGPTLEVPKLVNVRLLDPVLCEVFATLPVRWEVVGPAGSPFPVLDADVVLVPHQEGGTVLGVSGVYRLPNRTLGRGLDRFLLHGFAEATIRAFMSKVGVAIAAAANPAERELRSQSKTQLGDEHLIPSYWRAPAYMLPVQLTLPVDNRPR